MAKKTNKNKPQASKPPKFKPFEGNNDIPTLLRSMVRVENIVGISLITPENLQREDYLETLISFLKNSCEELVLEAISKLSELSFEESVIAVLIREDLLQSLMNILLQFNDWKPTKVEDQSQEAQIADSIKTNTLEAALTLLSNLCDNNYKILEDVIQQDFHSFCLRKFSLDFHKSHVALIAAQTLFKMSVDNSELFRKLNTDEVRKFIFDQMELPLKTPQFLLFKAACIGIIINSINPQHIEYESCMQMALGHVAQILGTKYADFEISEEIEKKSNFESFKDLVRAKANTLEILSDVFCSTKEMDLNDTEIELSENEFTYQEDKNEEKSLLQQFQSCNLAEIIAIYALNTPEELLGKSKEKDVDVELKNLKSTALICLQNTLNFYGSCIISDPNQCLQSLDQFLQLAFTDNQVENIIEGALLNVRSLIAVMIDLKVQLPQLSESIQKLLAIALSHSTNTKIVTTIVRICSLVALNGIKNNNCNNLKDLSLLVIQIAFSHESIEVLVECLDCLIDVFSEDEAVNTAGEIDLANKMETLRRIFNRKIKLIKSLDRPEVYVTVQSNLKPFVDYLIEKLNN